MQKSSAVKKVWGAFSTTVVVLVVIFAVMLIGARLFGIQVYSVISGSMEPEYPVGSLIYVKKVEPSAIEVGDVITFVLSNETPATHRVVEIDKENQLFYTRGDANFEINEDTGEKEYMEDPPVHFNNLIGKPVFTIPLLGYFAYYIQHPPGMYIAIVAGSILVLLVFLPDLFNKDKKENKAIPNNAGDINQG